MWVESTGEKIEMPVNPGFDRVRIDQIFTPIRPFFSRHHHLGLGHVAKSNQPRSIASVPRHNAVHRHSQ